MKLGNRKEKMVFDENLCENCHSELREGDKYCRYCGTKRGKGAYRPAEMDMECVYAPPVKTQYKCQACGYEWTVKQLGRDDSEYCPQCGEKKLSVQYDDDWENWDDKDDEDDDEE